MKAQTRFEAGDVIAQRYEIRSVIGRGGQGLVYRALDRWMQSDVAIKVLSSKAARDPQTAERLMREQQALSALKGTAAVEVFDVFRSDHGQLCLVMELLVGTDLDDHLYSIEQRNQRMELPQIVEVFDPIVETLEVAHGAGILHRDLKPANVFLLDNGGVRLLDFGMARLGKSKPLTAAGTVMGSPSFMAPEAWAGQPGLIDHRADVYSLGVILFRILARELPFPGESLQEKLFSATQGARPSLRAKRPDLPRDADEWVALALAIDREERFGNVRALWNAFGSTFRVKLPKGKKGPSFWLAARGAVQRLAQPGEPARAKPERTSEPSFGREALARSVMHVSRPGTTDTKAPVQAEATRVEKTLELTDSDLKPSPPPPPPPRAGRAVEKTLDLSDSDLVVPGKPPRRRREPSTRSRRKPDR